MQKKHDFSEIAIRGQELLQSIEKYVQNEIVSLREDVNELKRDGIPSKKYLTYDDVAKMTNYKVGYLQQLVFRNEIPSFRMNGSVRFEREAIEEWIKGRANTRSKPQ